MRKVIGFILLSTILIFGIKFFIHAQTTDDITDTSLQGTPPHYDIPIIEKGTTILGHLYELDTTDSKGNFITCIILEDKISCYKNENALPI